jgi:Winged helix DNA-binding domain
MRTISVGERRARLGVRHGLATQAETVDQVADALVALHSSDPVTVYLTAFARVARFTPADLEDALYVRKSLLRMLGMRRTLFVVPRDVAAVMDEACTKVLAPAQRRRLVGLVEEQGIAADGSKWVRRVSERTLTALRGRSEAAAVELTQDVPDLRKKLTFGEGKTWGGDVGVSTRILFLLATEGKIVRTRPRGTWVSGQYRWADLETWLGGPLPTLGRAEASAELLRRWLRAFGPGTPSDIRWWTGWTVRQMNAALEAVGATEVDVDGAMGFVLPGDGKATRKPRPWVRLLPGLDPTVMGWKERDWYLGEHGPTLFDRNGNAGPTVWADGRVVGGWTQAADGSVVVELLETVDRATQTRLRRERERLEAWLGGTRIVPRFRTPFERALSSRGG